MSALAGKLAVLALLTGSLLSRPACAAASRHEDEVARCIHKAASGRKWLEITLWGLRDQEGGWAGAAIRNHNGSEDLGPLQINSWWIPRIASATNRGPVEVRQWLRDDICFNIASARWIFLGALQVEKDYWAAVGAYHSPTGWRRQRYVRAVADHLRRRFGAKVFDSS